MNHTMICREVQRAMDSAFDEGVALTGQVAAHAATCRACAAYGNSLAALDTSLHLAPPIQPAPALVARIQAEIATQPRQALRPWAYPVGVAGAVMILAALGPALNGIPWIPAVDSGSWVIGEPFLPEWDFLRQELTTIPVGLTSDLAAFGQWSENSWASVSHWLSAFGRGFSPWVWVVFMVCGAAACALDGMEWMSRRMNRTGR